MSIQKLLFFLLCIAFQFSQGSASASPFKFSLQPYTPPPTNFLALQDSNSTSKIMRIVGYEGMQYVATVTIGSSNTTFQLLLDTGTSWLWVPDSTLSDHTFSEKTKLNCALSTTCKAEDKRSITVSSKSGDVRAYSVKEQITFTNVTVPDVAIGLATSVQNLDGLNADGVLGLGFSRKRRSQFNFIDTLYNRSLISSRTFSLFLCNDPYETMDSHSELIIDGYDENRTNETSFTYIKLGRMNDWVLNVTGFRINNHSVSFETFKKTPVAQIATNRGYVGFPTVIINAILNSLKRRGIACTYDLMNFPKCQCDHGPGSFPSLYFTFSNSDNDTVELVMRPESYVIERESSCELQMNTIPAGANDSEWILGNNFLRNYYMMFNMENSSIGFANVTRIKHMTRSKTANALYLGVAIIVFGFMMMFWVLVAKSLFRKRKERADSDIIIRMTTYEDTRMAY